MGVILGFCGLCLIADGMLIPCLWCVLKSSANCGVVGTLQVCSQNHNVIMQVGLLIPDFWIGTLNFQPRVHKFKILFTPNANATAENPGARNLFFFYQETIRFYGPDGEPVCF